MANPITNFGNWAINNVFGFSLGDRKPTSNTTLPTFPDHQQNPTFSPPLNDDGAVVLQGGGHFATYLDMDSLPRNEVEQIRKYRRLGYTEAEVKGAVDNIVNAGIVRDNSGKCVKIILDGLDEINVPDFIKERITEEFNQILRMLNFGQDGPNIFRRWYIDGRLFFHIVINKDESDQGIKELRYIDPRKIRKIREIIKGRDQATGMETIVDMKEYYMYNERGIMTTASNFGVKISPDSILYVPSGLIDPDTNMVISYLQKAIKPFNNLRMIEDSLVIYRVARAPERRAFYVDVGNMPTVKANQYIQDLMTKYKNKLVYDATTGEVKDDRRTLNMLEDYWLARREGSKGTEIITLPGGENLGKIEDVEYMQKKLYKALDVPISRLEPQTGFSLGRSAEITRDEENFMVFVDSLRVQFSEMFDIALKTQLVLKGICSEEDWEDFREHIYYDFIKDNNFTELKEQEILRERFMLVQLLEPYQGKYVSAEWIRKEILKQTDEEIEEMDEQIEEEMTNPRFINPMLNGGLGGGPMGLGGPEMGGAGGMPPGMGGPPGMPKQPGMGGPQQPGMLPQGAGNPLSGASKQQQPPQMNSNVTGKPDDSKDTYPTGNRFMSGKDGLKPAPKKGKKPVTKKKAPEKK